MNCNGLVVGLFVTVLAFALLVLIMQRLRISRYEKIMLAQRHQAKYPFMVDSDIEDDTRI